MKIRRYLAPDLRHALRQVREAQGPDAVILSTQRLADGVEVVAAVDLDAAADLEAPRAEGMDHEVAEHQGAAPLSSAPLLHEADLPREFESIAQRALDGDAAGAVGEELRTLRRMLETQLAALAWNDLSRRAPRRTEILRELAGLGLAHDLAAQIAGEIAATDDLAKSRRHAFSLIAERVAVTGDRWLESGGRIALIGPTGAGKTTTLAKLAARWVLRHGSRQLTLVSCDAARLGGHEQIRTLGALLDAAVYTVDDAAELGELLPELAERRLVLIDTAGLGYREPGFETQLGALAAAVPQLETVLVLAATTQAAALDEAARRFATATPRGVVLTKLDEAASLGGALSMLLRSRLPLAYVSEGRRVPEDLRAARSLELVARAVELARACGAAADEDALMRSVGGAARVVA
jgi:flagellar biosynthesis protein FlhF